jgi:hypothetical protein
MQSIPVVEAKRIPAGTRRPAAGSAARRPERGAKLKAIFKCSGCSAGLNDLPQRYHGDSARLKWYDRIQRTRNPKSLLVVASTVKQWRWLRKMALFRRHVAGEPESGVRQPVQQRSLVGT